MFELVAPDASFYPSFAESHREWAASIRTVPGCCQTTTSRARRGSLPGSEGWPKLNGLMTDGIVPCTYRWITEGSRYVGAIAFRHYLTRPS